MTGDIVITLTVKPLRGGRRPIIVSAASTGEMPLITAGHFPDRHALIDSAYQQMLTRKPRVVKVTAEKSQARKSPKPGKSQTPPKGEEFDDKPEESKSVETPERRRCRICGCTDAQACEGGCTWIEDDLCSNCEGKDKPDPDPPADGDAPLMAPDLAGESQATLF